LFEGRFEVFDNFGGNDIGRGQVGRLFQRFVLEPEDVIVTLLFFPNGGFVITIS